MERTGHPDNDLGTPVNFGAQLHLEIVEVDVRCCHGPTLRRTETQRNVWLHHDPKGIRRHLDVDLPHPPGDTTPIEPHGDSAGEPQGVVRATGGVERGVRHMGT
jgi:hypothetical protein